MRGHFHPSTRGQDNNIGVGFARRNDAVEAPRFHPMLDVRYVFPVDGSRVVAPRDCKAILEQLRLEIALEVVILGVAATPFREPEQKTHKGSLTEPACDA